MRGRDQPNVRVPHWTVCSHRLHLAGFRKPKQHGLHSQTHFSQFVQEQRAAVGETDEPGLVAVGSREAAARVAKQLRLEQRFGNPRAVDRDETAGTSRARLVNQARNHFLPHSCFTRHEHLGLAARRNV